MTRPRRAPKNVEPGPPKRYQGFYTLPDGTKLISVTTVLDQAIAKPGLPFWAAGEVARCAVESIPQLARVRGEAAREEMYAWLRRAATVKRDAAAALGSAIHHAIDAHVLGTPWPQPTDEQRPFLDAFARFLEAHQPEFEATEMVLANPDDGWAGTGDAWMRFPRIRRYARAIVLGDWKTGKSPHAEAAMQLAAYRRATVGYLRDGTEVAPPATDAAVVVHLRPDRYPGRGYAIYPLDTSDAVYEQFLHARRLALGWTRGLAKTALGDPIPLDDDEPTEEVA